MPDSSFHSSQPRVERGIGSTTIAHLPLLIRDHRLKRQFGTTSSSLFIRESSNGSLASSRVQVTGGRTLDFPFPLEISASVLDLT